MTLPDSEPSASVFLSDYTTVLHLHLPASSLPNNFESAFMQEASEINKTHCPSFVRLLLRKTSSLQNLIQDDKQHRRP